MSEEIMRLADELASGDSDQRTRAAEALCQAGAAAKTAAAALVCAAGDSSEEVSEQAVGALEELGPPPTETSGQLAELLVNENADIAYWAATLLGRLGEAANPVAGALAAALGDHPAVVVRQQAAAALGKIGPGAAVALPQLQAAAGSDDPRLARLAGEAVARLQG